jgi:hypothetical protein
VDHPTLGPVDGRKESSLPDAGALFSDLSLSPVNPPEKKRLLSEPPVPEVAGVLLKYPTPPWLFSFLVKHQFQRSHSISPPTVSMLTAFFVHPHCSPSTFSHRVFTGGRGRGLISAFSSSSLCIQLPSS